MDFSGRSVIDFEFTLVMKLIVAILTSMIFMPTNLVTFISPLPVGLGLSKTDAIIDTYGRIEIAELSLPSEDRGRLSKACDFDSARGITFDDRIRFGRV